MPTEAEISKLLIVAVVSRTSSTRERYLIHLSVSLAVCCVVVSPKEKNGSRSSSSCFTYSVTLYLIHFRCHLLSYLPKRTCKMMNSTEEEDGSCPPCPVCEADSSSSEQTLTMSILMVYQSSILPISKYIQRRVFLACMAVLNAL